MPEFLANRGITSAIENIINNAEKSLVLVSPFIKIPDSLFQNLVAADKQNIRITIIFGKRKLDEEVVKQLKKLNSIKMMFLENLHAKCYFNEKSMVITSLNLYDYSEQNNREIGILITRDGDENVYNEAIREIQRIYHLSTPHDLVQETTHEKTDAPQYEKEQLKESILEKFLGSLFGQGYCIECRTRIDFDEYKPYCAKCYKLVKNKQRKAKYCHECGAAFKTTLYKPLCELCFEKSISKSWF